MKKLQTVLLLFTFMFGYMEWGKEKHSTFIFQAIGEIFFNLRDEPKLLAHPLILLPLIGIMLLVYTLFQKIPDKVLGISGLACLSVLMLLLLFVGIISVNFRVIFSVIPFFIIAILFIKSTKSAARQD